MAFADVRIALSNSDIFTDTIYSTVSDYCIKSNVVPLGPEEASRLIKNMRPVMYSSTNGGGCRQHELQEVVKELFVETKDGNTLQAVDYGRITPVLIAALQNVLKRLENLETRLATMTSKA